MRQTNPKKAARRRACRESALPHLRSYEAKMHLARLSGLLDAARLRMSYLDVRRQVERGRTFRPSRRRGGYCATAADLLQLVKNDIRSQLVAARAWRQSGAVIRFLP